MFSAELRDQFWFPPAWLFSTEGASNLSLAAIEAANSVEVSRCCF
jgi:hypothetical protein